TEGLPVSEQLREAGTMPAVSPVRTSLLIALAALPDHRRAAGRRHALPAVLAFVCCGMLCGGRSLLAIAEWGRAHKAWCCAVFGFRRCTPCVSTLHPCQSAQPRRGEGGCRPG